MSTDSSRKYHVKYRNAIECKYLLHLFHMYYTYHTFMFQYGIVCQFYDPPWNYPGGVVPLQIVEGHYLFSTKWVGLDDGISTKWSAQRKQYKMTGHIHKQVILDEERNSMLYRSCSGGTCPCIKTKTHFVDMLRVTTNWVARFSVISKISGKGLYKMTPDFLT